MNEPPIINDSQQQQQQSCLDKFWHTLLSLLLPRVKATVNSLSSPLNIPT